MNEENITNSEKPIIYVQQPDQTNRTALWVLLATVTGFMLPICSCFFLMTGSLFSLSLMAGDPASGVGDAVAIIYVDGPITAGDEEMFAAGAVSGLVLAELEKAAADPTVKAIVLRVDSPGGSVTGSAQIHEAVAAMEKPVVASMAGVAASGGYYVSAPADYIFARPDTITGSIGVIFTIFNAEELLDQLGVEVITITSGPNKELGSLWSEMTPEQREIIETLLDESFAEFVRIVAEGREMDSETVLQLADGRIYSGRQAAANGLVDELGDLQAAIDKAAELGGIEGEPRIVKYDRLPSLSQLFSGLVVRLFQSEAAELRNTIYDFTAPKLEYRYVGPSD